MKKDIKYAAAVESEAQTLETIKAASAAHDVQYSLYHQRKNRKSMLFHRLARYSDTGQVLGGIYCTETITKKEPQI